MPGKPAKSRSTKKELRFYEKKSYPDATTVEELASTDRVVLYSTTAKGTITGRKVTVNGLLKRIDEGKVKIKGFSEESRAFFTKEVLEIDEPRDTNKNKADIKRWFEENSSDDTANIDSLIKFISRNSDGAAFLTEYAMRQNVAAADATTFEGKNLTEQFDSYLEKIAKFKKFHEGIFAFIKSPAFKSGETEFRTTKGVNLGIDTLPEEKKESKSGRGFIKIKHAVGSTLLSKYQKKFKEAGLTNFTSFTKLYVKGLTQEDVDERLAKEDEKYVNKKKKKNVDKKAAKEARDAAKEKISLQYQQQQKVVKTYFQALLERN